jgi:hypothetical protein
MMLLGSVAASILVALAALHAYWGVGGFWPGVDAKSCARTVGGFPGATNMPGPAACFAVAAALAVAALVAAAQSGLVTLPLPSGLILVATVGAALVFLGRGIAGFTPAWRRLTPELPFARLDRQYYSPLCLFLGAAFVILASKGLG